MYNLVLSTYTKSEIAYALIYATHTLQVSSQYQACFKSREIYYNLCNPQEK